MVRAYLYLAVFVPLTFLLAFSALICTFFDGTGKLYHRHAQLWARISLWLAGVKVEVSGREKIPLDKPVIFMSNHQSNFDILALYMAIPIQFAWLAKEELFRFPVFGHSMRRAGYIPLDRSDGRRSLKGVEAAAAIVRKGQSVIVFPEGTRTKDGELLPFKKGGFFLAEKAGVPIVPFTINGGMKVNPRNRIELYPGTIRVNFAEPVPTVAAVGRERERLMEQVRAAIASGLES